MHIGTITDLVDHVQTAGEMALDAQRDLNSLQRDLKEDGSIVTRTDRQVEELLYAAIARRYPEANILTEETARTFDADKPYTFCIDPIDGTDVYSQGMAGWCVSVGLLDQDLAPIAGIICAPRLGLLFVADVGRTATFNGAEIRLPGEAQLLSARANLMVPSHMHHFLDIRRFPGKIRSLGSAALHLCYPLVYRAVYAAIQVPGAHIWDIAGAHAICASLGICFEYIDGSAVDYRPLVDGRPFDKVILSGPRPHIEAIKGVITQI